MTITTALISLLLTRASSLRRVAVVTGGTRGIGRGISEALAEHDFDLLVSYNSDEAAAEQAAGELKTKYNCAVACVGGDVSLEGSIELGHPNNPADYALPPTFLLPPFPHSFPSLSLGLRGGKTDRPGGAAI